MLSTVDFAELSALEDEERWQQIGELPDASHHEWLNSAIHDELVNGRVVDATRRRVLGVTEELWDAGAGGVLLGCTELELLIRQADCELPVYPCTTLHVAAALDRAL